MDYDAFAALTSVKDALPTPNVVSVTYNAIGQVDRVTAVGGGKYLQFEYFATGTKLLQFVKLFADSGLRVTAEYQYTSDNLTSVLLGGSPLETYTYSGNLMTSRKDGLGNSLLDLRYVTGAGGKMATVGTSKGEVGYDYSHASCNGGAGTRVYFNRWNTTTSCNTDGDCGTGNFCGGKTASGAATGMCYRAWRCLGIDTTNEHLVTTVTGSCPSCVQTAQYTWSTSRFLTGRKSADNVWISILYDANGKPTKVVEGDTDSDANTVPTGIWPTWLFYGNASFPGKLTESRRKSALSTSTCDSATSTGCKRTITAYTTGGLVDTVNEQGFTYDAAGLITAYNFTTDNNYDSKGRLTQVLGPRPSVVDNVNYTYYGSGNGLSTDYLFETKREKATGVFLTTTTAQYDYWGHAARTTDPNMMSTCRTWHPQYNQIASSREVINGSHTDCTIVGSEDAQTSYLYDSGRRMTRLTRPEGNCTILGYDGRGRLTAARAAATTSSMSTTILRTATTASSTARSFAMRVAPSSASRTWVSARTGGSRPCRTR